MFETIFSCFDLFKHVVITCILLTTFSYFDMHKLQIVTPPKTVFFSLFMQVI